MNVHSIREMLWSFCGGYDRSASREKPATQERHMCFSTPSISNVQLSSECIEANQMIKEAGKGPQVNKGTTPFQGVRAACGLSAAVMQVVAMHENFLHSKMEARY